MYKLNIGLKGIQTKYIEIKKRPHGTNSDSTIEQSLQIGGEKIHQISKNDVSIHRVNKTLKVKLT